jgi:8-amino-7-oxononanoate synthase
MKNEACYQHFLQNNIYPRSLKSLEVIQGFSAIYLQKNGKKLINFSSSDCLGLATHPLLISRAKHYLEQYGTSVSASRLVTGNLACYAELEEQLAMALNKPAALIIGSGYQTNQSVLHALLDPAILGHEPLVFCDKLSHASILAGIAHLPRLHRYRHNDLTHLRRLLEKYKTANQANYIVAESLYSMEGDTVNLKELITLAKEYHAFLYIDDAHALGVAGEQGWGYAAQFSPEISVIMGTFSKALGSFGGFVACSETVKEFLVNKCRGLIYATGLSPAILGAMSAALELIPTLNKERHYLEKISQRMREFFLTENLNYGDSSTHIIPWIIGDAKKTIYASELLEQHSILATGIQPPSVPAGKSRIRFCLSAEHSEEDIAKLMTAISQVRIKLSIG